MAGQPLNVSTDLRPGGVAVVHVTGEIDVDTCPVLADALTGLLDSGIARLALDLSGVPFLDSTAVNALLRANLNATARGGQVRLAALQPAPLRVVLLVGLEQVIPLDPDVDHAVRALGAPHPPPCAADAGGHRRAG